MAYQYPASEERTDALEAAMDPHKLHRERSAISQFASFDWKVALDFGCGVGRNFDLLAEIAQRTDFPRRLRAIDPDAQRVAAAVRAADELKSRDGRLGIKVARGAQAELLADTTASPTRYDLILCAQVLGHVTTSACDEILGALAGALATPGSLLILVPFATEPTIRHAYGAAYEERQDYFFAADLSRVDDPASHRIRLSRNEFNDLVANPRDDLLPVRSFAVPALVADGWHECPALMTERPDFAGPVSARGAHVAALAYTIHEFAPGQGGAAFGDMLVRVSGGSSPGMDVPPIS